MAPSAVRRAVIAALVGPLPQGSISDFTRYTGSNYASVHRELHALSRAGFVSLVGDGRALRALVNFDHPDYRFVRQLVVSSQELTTKWSPSEQEILQQLAGFKKSPIDFLKSDPPKDVSGLVADAAGWARWNPWIAYGLLWLLLARPDLIVAARSIYLFARRHNSVQEVGAFFQVASQIVANVNDAKAYVARLPEFADRRWRSPDYFELYPEAMAPGWQKLAREETSASFAKQWGWYWYLPHALLRSWAKGAAPWPVVVPDDDDLFARILQTLQNEHVDPRPTAKLAERLWRAGRPDAAVILARYSESRTFTSEIHAEAVRLRHA